MEAQGKVNEAVKEFYVELGIRRKFFPISDPTDDTTMMLMNNFAGLLSRLDRHEEAEVLFRELLEERDLERRTGPQAFAGLLLGLASSLAEQRKNTAEAVALMKRGLAIQERFLPPTHREIAITKSNLKICEKHLADLEKEKATSAIPEELRAKMIAELIDEDDESNNTKKKKKLHKGKK